MLLSRDVRGAKPSGIPMRRSPRITVMPPRPSASMALAGMQSFRAQHSSGYQSCAYTGAQPKMMLIRPDMAANARRVAPIFMVEVHVVRQAPVRAAELTRPTLHEVKG